MHGGVLSFFPHFLHFGFSFFTLIFCSIRVFCFSFLFHLSIRFIVLVFLFCFGVSFVFMSKFMLYRAIFNFCVCSFFAPVCCFFELDTNFIFLLHLLCSSPDAISVADIVGKCQKIEYSIN